MVLNLSELWLLVYLQVLVVTSAVEDDAPTLLSTSKRENRKPKETCGQKCGPPVEVKTVIVGENRLTKLDYYLVSNKVIWPKSGKNNENTVI